MKPGPSENFGGPDDNFIIEWGMSGRAEEIDSKEELSHPDMSFWYETPTFQSSGMSDAIRYAIEEVEESEECKILIGKEHITRVKGRWREIEFRENMVVSVMGCRCCPNIGGGSTSENSSNGSNSDGSLCNTSFVNNNGDLNNTSFASSSLRAVKEIHCVDDTNGNIMIEDHVISVTAFCTALECINHPLLSKSVADFSFQFSHKSLAIGIIIHELLEKCLIQVRGHEGTAQVRVRTQIHCREDNWICKIDEKIMEEARNTIDEHGLTLYSCNMTEKEMFDEITQNFRNIKNILLRGLGVEGIEESVISTLYGLKGKIDCIGRDNIIEIKTGQSRQVSHRAQVLWYWLLSSEKTCKKTGKRPMIYYVKTGETDLFQEKHDELSGLLILRNKIAALEGVSPCACEGPKLCVVYNKVRNLPKKHFLRQQLEGIEHEAAVPLKYIKGIVLSSTFTASGTLRYIFKTNEKLIEEKYCSIFSRNHKLITTGIVGLVNEFISHVEITDSLCFEREVYISMENNGPFYRYMFWSLFYVAYPKYLLKRHGCDDLGFKLPGEDYGLCVDDCEDDHANDDGVNVNNDKANSDTELSNFSFSDFESTVKVLDSESGFTLPTSDCTSAKNTSAERKLAECSLEDDWDIDMNSFTSDYENEVNANGMNSKCEANTNGVNSKCEVNVNGVNSKCEVNVNGVNSKCEVSAIPNKVDHPSEQSSIEFNSIDLSSDLYAAAINESSELLNALSDDLSIASKKQCLNAEDSRTEQHPAEEQRFPIPPIYQKEFGNLNEGQKSSLLGSLECRKYKIVHGMPGTGKSTMISLLIKILLYYDQRVLVISYTNMAIENLIKKLRGFKVYRAGKRYKDYRNLESCDSPKDCNPSKDHNSLRKYSSDEYRAFFQGQNLVFGTCFCFDDPVFRENHFDFCMIDEGSQIHYLLNLTPISISDRFCIVGDHLQLKPLSRSGNALSVSLFECLVQGCSMLTEQYRMSDEIMRLSNELFYDNRMTNGRKDGKAERVNAGNAWAKDARGMASCANVNKTDDASMCGKDYCNGSVANMCGKDYCNGSVANVCGKDYCNGSVTIVDTGTVDLIEYVKTLRNCTILCYFNVMVKELQKITSLAVTTVDKYQGSEDDVICVVFDPIKDCEVMFSRERLNVSLTRARNKLILVGDAVNMRKIDILEQLLDKIESRDLMSGT